MSNNLPESLDDIERMISNPFYSGSTCPLASRMPQTKDCAFGVELTKAHLSKEDQYKVLVDIIPKLRDVPCDVCRCKGYLIMKRLAISCAPDFVELFEACFEETSLGSRRSKHSIRAEVLGYFAKFRKMNP